jgi:molybdopterin-binding protein
LINFRRRIASQKLQSKVVFSPARRKIVLRSPNGSAAETELRTSMRISARNSIAGKVVGIRNSANTAHVDISIVGTILTAEVTNETLEELDLKIGDKVYAVVKPNDILLATD